MAFATINLFGVTDPAAGYLQESSQEKSVEVATCKDATGVTKLAVPKGVVTTTVTLKGKGTYSPSVSRNTAVGSTAVITSAKASESNDDFPDYEITYQKFAST
jgi:hypothetical protein